MLILIRLLKGWNAAKRFHFLSTILAQSAQLFLCHSKLRRYEMTQRRQLHGNFILSSAERFTNLLHLQLCSAGEYLVKKLWIFSSV